MESESAAVDCSENEDAAAVDPSIEATDLPAGKASTAIEAELEQGEKAEGEEKMSLDEDDHDEPSKATSESKESEKSDATEQDKNITEITSEKTEESSIMKLDSTKPIETDLDSSIELISSPISEQLEAADKIIKGSTDESDAVKECVGSLMESTDAPKSTEDDLDSSIELIESPVLKELSETDNIKDSNCDSNSSIELISSPRNTEGSNEEETGSKTDDKKSVNSNPDKNDKDTEECEDTQIVAEHITQSKTNTEDATIVGAKLDSAMPTKSTTVEEDPIAPQSMTEAKEPQQLDESSKAQQESIQDEPMETEPSQEVESSCLVKLYEEDYKETKPEGDSKESVDYEEDNEIYYKKDCLNCNCEKLHKQYVRASLAALNYYKVPRKAHKRQYICMGCYDTAMDMYEVCRPK